MVETTQTALSGANVYYWFISGFGDFERLTNSHYAPIAIPIITGIISFIVQMYFCHRIWTLTRNVWLCTAIIVVCVSDPPRVVGCLTFLDIDIDDFNNGGIMGGLSSK